MTHNWQYKVVKSQRNGQGQWFNYPAAATFATEDEARQYAEQFAAEQKGVGGTRILVQSRRKRPGDFGPTHHVAEYPVR